MTGEEFVKLCYEEKEAALKEYFDVNGESLVSEKIKNLIESGTDRDALQNVVDLVMNECFYALLLGLDGEASLGNVQMTYKLYDEDDNLLNECGEIEAAAFEYFMEES